MLIMWNFLAIAVPLSSAGRFILRNNLLNQKTEVNIRRKINLFLYINFTIKSIRANYSSRLLHQRPISVIFSCSVAVSDGKRAELVIRSVNNLRLARCHCSSGLRFSVSLKRLWLEVTMYMYILTAMPSNQYHFYNESSYLHGLKQFV